MMSSTAIALIVMAAVLSTATPWPACAALPALFYADRVAPLGDGFANVSAYLDRLKARPSVTRVLREAEPYFQFFPKEEA